MLQLKRSLRAKTTSQAGETLVETLVSVLVAGMSMLMLATAISMASNIVANTNAAAQNYYSESSVLASGSTGGLQGTVNITVKDSGIVTGKNGIQVVSTKTDLPGGVVGIAYQVQEGS